MRFIKFLILNISVICACTSCRNEPLDVDISEVNYNVKIQRLEQDLFSLETNSIAGSTEKLGKKYGNYYQSFIFNILNHGEQRDSVYKSVGRFTQDKDISNMYQQTTKIFTDDKIKGIEEELNASFKYFKYHFPKRETPKYITTFVSGWNFQITTMDSTLGIGLDMYLGSENEFYQMLQFPQYRSVLMSEKYIVSDAVKSWMIHCFDTGEPINNLLNHMIFNGKLYYCVDAVLRETPDSIKIGYTGAQLKYCKDNEKNLWNYFTQQERLYKNDLKELTQFINDGPFTGAISKECPPRIGHWVGWQIVRSYMERNPEVTLEMLINEKDVNKIMTKSKYKP